MTEPPGAPIGFGGPRHDWSIEDIEWDQNEVRAGVQRSKSPEGSGGASSAQQAVSSAQQAVSSAQQVAPLASL